MSKFSARRDGNEGSEARSEKDQEKAPALLLHRRGHNRPQCGRCQGRGLTLFRQAEIPVDAEFQRKAKKRRYCEVFNNAITKWRRIYR